MRVPIDLYYRKSERQSRDGVEFPAVILHPYLTQIGAKILKKRNKLEHPGSKTEKKGSASKLAKINIYLTFTESYTECQRTDWWRSQRQQHVLLTLHDYRIRGLGR